MFSGNLKIQNSVKIINAVEEGKFPLLLNRIVQFLCNGSSSKPFTSIEEEKLENSFEITKSEVQMLVDGIIEIFRTCAYHVVKPQILSEQLQKGLSMSAKKTEMFVQSWAASARGIVDNLRQRIYFPQLSHLSYSVSVEAASDYRSKEKLPRAQIQLGLASSNKRKELNLEFNHEELYEFYKKLEQIQGQLDSFR